MPADQPNLFAKPKEIVLREYQESAVAKCLWAKGLEGNDLVVLPTGSGKSVVIAHLAKALNEDLLILQPSKEILEQNRAKLALYVNPGDIGTYSASMNEKTISKYTFATIQSIYKKPELFCHFKTVLIDECHSLNPKNLGGMFTSFLHKIGNPKVIGFTATPYRMDIAYEMIYGDLVAFTSIKLINRVKSRFWSRLIFNVNNHELLEKGYLAPLEYIDKTLIEHADIPTNKSMSDFDMEAYEGLIKGKKEQIVQAIAYARTLAKSILVFCSSVKQAEEMQELFPNDSVVVSAKTSKADREKYINQFRAGTIPIIFNMGVLTTGFDHPSLDCIIMVRPTRSIALYYQMLGRGVRLAPGKTKCYVIDLSSNVKNLGRIETIVVTKESGKWELLSETGSWHCAHLYSYTVKSGIGNGSSQRPDNDKPAKASTRDVWNQLAGNPQAIPEPALPMPPDDLPPF